MNRGKPILSWSEPADWQRAANRLARTEGGARFPWRTWSLALALFAGWSVASWLDADPAGRPGIPGLVGIIASGCAFFLALGWIRVRLGRGKRTTIFEGGLLHGSRFESRWTPWSRIECFALDQETLGPWTFRFLSWRKIGEEDEDYSVVPDSVDLSRLVDCFARNSIEQVAADGPGAAPTAAGLP